MSFSTTVLLYFGHACKDMHKLYKSYCRLELMPPLLMRYVSATPYAQFLHNNNSNNIIISLISIARDFHLQLES